MYRFPDAAWPLAISLLVRGRSSDETAAIIERFWKSERPLLELEKWLSEEHRAGRLDFTVFTIASYAIRQAQVRSGEIDRREVLVGLTEDGTLIDTRGRVLPTAPRVTG